MGLEIFGHGVSGEILVEDQRPDGSTILLQCAPYGQTLSSEPSGVTVASSAGGSWPMLQEAGIARKRRGKLHLDTTQMPGGVLTFNVSTLADKAAEALDLGIRFVELTADNAKEWGYSEPRSAAKETADMPEASSARGAAPRRGSSSQGRPHNAPGG